MLSLSQVLSLSKRTVTCIYFETFADITCQFFKCSPGSSCHQLELVNEQSGTGNLITFRLDITQFPVNDTFEFIVCSSNQMKSVDIQGIIGMSSVQQVNFI